jgi:transcriptional regulator with XRE-family HTH domain
METLTIGWAQRIDRARKLKKMSTKELGRLVGITGSAVRLWKTGGGIKTENFEKLADVLGVRLEWLTTGPGEMNVDRREGLSLSVLEVLSVGRAVEAENGFIRLSDELIESVPMPPGLAKRDYGLFVPGGGAMVPAFRYGDTLWIDPLLPCSEDMEVVIRKDNDRGDGEGNAIICTLVTFDDSNWTVETLKPEPRRFMLPRDEWTLCHRIVGKQSRR